jgi:hypothetical protein
MMTLEQFIATKRETDDVGKEIGDGTLDGIPGVVYDDAWYIERNTDGSGLYSLVLESSYFQGTLAECEPRLYQFVVDSQADDAIEQRIADKADTAAPSSDFDDLLGVVRDFVSDHDNGLGPSIDRLRAAIEKHADR